MQAATLFLLSAVIAGAFAGGQYYVPRSYYVIDAEGHESVPVPLHRLRRAALPTFYRGIPGSSANANANAIANAEANGWNGGYADAKANAEAQAHAGAGGYGVPGAIYGSSRPLSSGQTSRQYGQVLASRSVEANSAVGINSNGNGYYDQATSVH